MRRIVVNVRLMALPNGWSFNARTFSDQLGAELLRHAPMLAGNTKLVASGTHIPTVIVDGRAAGIGRGHDTLGRRVGEAIYRGLLP